MRPDDLLLDRGVMLLAPNSAGRQLPRMGVSKRHQLDKSRPIDSSALAISLDLWWVVGFASCAETREIEVIVTPYMDAGGTRVPRHWTGYTLAMPVRDFMRYVV